MKISILVARMCDLDRPTHVDALIRVFFHGSEPNRVRLSYLFVYSYGSVCSGTVRSFAARIYSGLFTVPNRIAFLFGSVRFGSIRFGSVRFGLVRFGSVRLGSARCCAVRCGEVRCL